MSRALVCAAVLLVACESGAEPAAWTCTLTRVIDGDTLHARCDGEKVKVRLLRIDTPAREEPGYLLAYVRVRGEIANVEMVRLGWSPFWTKYGKGRFAGAFRAAEREAREAHRGLWAEASAR